MKIELRRAHSRKDAKRLSRLDRKIFAVGEAFRERNWWGCRCFWIVVDGKIAGSIAMSHNKEFRSLYIDTIGIIPSLRGKGIGTFVLDWQIEYAKKLGCRLVTSDIRLSNKRSVYLHERAGFKVAGVVKDFYDNPKEDGLRLELWV